MLKKWEELPDDMKNDAVKKYYDILYKKRYSLLIKRIFDFAVAIILLILLSPLFILVSIAIKLDSPGPILFRQIRITQYGKRFKIYKFRTMVENAEKLGSQVTVGDDKRITKVGRILRKYRLDEIPQLFNVISGDMTFVGPRPEVEKYVEKYTDEMKATFLIPAGITSEASIEFKDEEKLLSAADDVDKTYVEVILPKKMEINLRSLENFSFFNDVKVMVKTILAVLK